MGAAVTKSLPMAIGLNLLFPGLGYFYMGKWLVGIVGSFLVFAINLTTGLLFLIPAWLALNLIMAIDMVILMNKNKSRVLSETTIKCPNCAELIQREAKVCRFCSFQLANNQDSLPATTPVPAASTNAQPALTVSEVEERPSSGNGAWAVPAVLIVVALLLLAVNHQKSKPAVLEGAEPKNPAIIATQSTASPGNWIGDVVKTRYFDITLNKVWIARRINPNAFVDIAANEGERFVVLEATIKNNDTEGRMFFPGKLQANVGGRTLTFDVTETVMSEEYTLLENLNPLTTIQKRIAFRVPTEATASLTWIPGRTETQIALADKPATRAPEPAPATSEPKNAAAAVTVAPVNTPTPTQTAVVAEKAPDPALVSWNPSFDCAKATTEAERLICSSKELSESDVAVSQLYARALTLASDKGEIRREQAIWLKSERDVCVDADCMLKAYRGRIARLAQ